MGNEDPKDREIRLLKLEVAITKKRAERLETLVKTALGSMAEIQAIVDRMNHKDARKEAVESRASG